MKTLANKQHEATHGLSQPPDMGIDYSPIPSINEAFDGVGPQMTGLEELTDMSGDNMLAELDPPIVVRIAK